MLTDHEHPEEGLNSSVVDFAMGTEVLIHDAQYAPKEKRGSKKGWGHIT